MKKIMTLASAIMMVAAANAEINNTAAFNEVKVSVPARVRVIKGEKYGVTVKAEEDFQASVVKYTVEDGKLLLTTNDETMFEQDKPSVLITITTPEDVNVTTSRGLIRKDNRK